MKIIKVCVCIVLAIVAVAVAVFACCKMSGDCDRRDEKEDGK